MFRGGWLQKVCVYGIVVIITVLALYTSYVYMEGIVENISQVTLFSSIPPERNDVLDTSHCVYTPVEK
jgi:hypothetical protein